MSNNGRGTQYSAPRIVLGALTGYVFSAASSAALFLLSHHNPHTPQHVSFIVITIVYGVLFSIAAGFVAAKIGGYQAGVAVGIMIFVVALLSMLMDPRGAHWSQVVALVAMCPSAVLGAKFAAPR